MSSEKYTAWGWLPQDKRGSNEELLAKYPVVPYPAIKDYRQEGPWGYHPVVDLKILRKIDDELHQKPMPPYEAMKTMPIKENGEPLINLLDLSPRFISLMTGSRMAYEGINQPRLLLRRTVAGKLLEILDNLDPEYGLGVYDAHRPNKVQQLWYEKELKRVGADEVKRWLCSPQTDPSLPPSPHSTGGAIDLTIVDLTNGVTSLDMGSYYGEWSARSWTHSQQISWQARENRVQLQSLMAGVGLINYSGEWWHYSYGDSYWAVAAKQPQAFYVRIEQ